MFSEKLKGTFAAATLTIILTLFFGWLTTATNTGGSGDPDWFAFTSGLISLVVLVGGCFLTVRTYLDDNQ